MKTDANERSTKSDIIEELQTVRECIDAIDAQLIPLFRRRMKAVEQVVRLKKEHNLPILDASREQQILDALPPGDGNGCEAEVAQFMRTLLALSKTYQRRQLGELPFLPPPRQPARGSAVCVYQGVPGAWSEQAAIRAFPQASRRAVEHSEDVFKAVKENRVGYGVVAIENSNTGAIGETYDLLRQYNCYIVGRVSVAIRQCLLAPKGVELPDNRTHFVVIATEPEYDQSSALISVTFSTAHRSGALCEALMPYMAGGLNLARIESRPDTAGQYRFFADIEGNILEARTQYALRQSASACGYFQVLGCYNQI